MCEAMSQALSTPRHTHQKGLKEKTILLTVFSTQNPSTDTVN